jgi:DnaK suppressor protein
MAKKKKTPAKKTAPSKPAAKKNKAAAKKAAPSKSHSKPVTKSKPISKSKPVPQPKSAPKSKPVSKSKPVVPLHKTKPVVPLKKTSASTPSPSSSAAKSSKPAISASDLKRIMLERKGAPKAIAFSLDEVREIAKKNESQIEAAAKAKSVVTKTTKTFDPNKLEKPAKPHFVKPASLADILGFSPGQGKKPSAMIDESEVPEKYRRYYRLLLELRTHVLTQLGEHTEETLLKSAKDDSGDLSGYGQHMADAGTDTFDRDFALSLVSNEQEALAEIEAAIKRVHAGTYGICETTLKPIAKERLLAVPFTRYSAEAKKEVERHSHRTQQRGGLFGEASEEDASKMASDDGDE